MDRSRAHDRRLGAGPGRVTAVLGPTNTGKTHLAIERMLAHRTGMIGLPLRLLAREVYDQVVERLGPEAVALVTGEEKIVPAAPRFYVSTVEAMPLDVSVDFLAIDEIQLAADGERGHIFTERLLSARGRSETIVLGSATMQSLMGKLLPGTNFVNRPRFSKLSYAGEKKITRLPRRTAIVGFSADQVYEVAELIRRQRGGAAVVLGALSPRTRNAQVALYQAGEVDFLVATDAIGMGLNMDVDHVAFAARRKFDGAHHRRLAAAELAQIAGRAGRHMNDGTFGTTGDCEPFDAETVERLENHRFDPVTLVQWRNPDIDFSTLDTLLASLAMHPRRDGLIRTHRGDDYAVLEHLARSEVIPPLLTGPDAVALFWETCQIPDFRKIGIGEHAAIVERVFRFLVGPEGLVPEDWLARQVDYADRTEGDIDTLANRIAHIRTWTFVANRAKWLGDPLAWQERTREVEDRLSDALHEQITQRFIDRRTSVLMKRLKEKESLLAGVSDDSEVVVEGEYVGRLDGLRFAVDSSAQAGADTRALQAAAMKILAGELAGRAQAIVKEEDGVFAATDSGYVTWRGATVARLDPGDAILKPQIRLLADEQLPAPDREAVLGRLDAWLTAHLRNVLAPLFRITEDAEITGLARGVAFRLVEHLGLMPRDVVADEVHQLEQPTRGLLRRHGVRFGAFSLYIPTLLKPQAAALRLLLFRLWQEGTSGRERADWPEPPQPGLTSLNVGADAPAAFYEAVGFRLCGPRAVRADMLERLGDTIRPLVNWKPDREGVARPDGAHVSGGFTVTPAMMSLVGCSGEDFAAILTALGFRREMLPAPKLVASAVPEAADEQVSLERSGEAGPGAQVAADVAGGTDEARPVATDGAIDATPVEGPANKADPAPPSEAAGSADTAGAPTPPEPSEPGERDAGAAEAEEPATIAVWRPRSKRRGRPTADTGQPRRRGRRHKPDGALNAAAERTRERSGNRKGSRAQDGEARGREAAGPAKNERSGRGPRSQPPVSDDSPFAALKVLKERMQSDPDRAPS